MPLPSISSFPQSASIVSRWKLTEASGNRADSVGSNTLTENGTGGVGSAAAQFSVDGADLEQSEADFLSIDDASQTGLDFTGDFSFSCWIKPETVSTNMGIFAKHLNTGNQRGYTLTYQGASNRFIFETSSTGAAGNFTLHSYTMTAGTWYHLAFVYDASAGEGDLYINGASAGGTQTGLNTSLFNNTAAFRLGDDGFADGTDSFDGVMSDAAIWGLELTAAEVASLYGSYSSSIRLLTLLGVGT